MGTSKKGIAVAVAVAAAATISVAPAPVSAAPVQECVPLPAGINNQSVLGQDVPGIKDVRFCVRSSYGVAGEPQVRNYEGCGRPCFAVVVRDLAVELDVELTVSYTLGGTPQPPMPVAATQKVEPLKGTYQCLYSYYDGSYNPCRDGVSTPANLKAAGKKTSITLAWDRSYAFGDSSVAHYEILRSATGEEGTFVPVSTATGLTFTDTRLPRATTFWYTVVAVDDLGTRSGAATPVTGSTS